MRTMEDNRKHCVLKKEIVYLGNEVEVCENFFDSQATTKSGRYKLQKINLKDIDVVIKNIANKSFFDWEDGVHINNIKKNFEKTPPVILEELNGVYYSVDGHHRITAAVELELSNILAFVIKVNKLTHIR
jgi:hypothetical protein